MVCMNMVMCVYTDLLQASAHKNKIQIQNQQTREVISAQKLSYILFHLYDVFKLQALVYDTPSFNPCCI